MTHENAAVRFATALQRLYGDVWKGFPMAWTKIERDDVLARLSGPETDALERVATDWAQGDPIPEVIAMVCEEWRAALRRRFRIGPALTVPSELRVHILADIRYRVFTRLPDVGLLDERRVAEYEQAREVLAHLDRYIVEEPPEEAAAASNPTAGVRIVNRTRRRFTRRSLDRL